MNVEIITTYRYRQAKIETGIQLPRTLFQFVQDKLEPGKRDNFQVICARICDDRVCGTVALYFADNLVVVGHPADVQMR